MKYRRNWAYEQNAEVFFLDGSESQCFCRTDSKGKIEYIIYNDAAYTPEQFGDLGITNVHFMTPAALQLNLSDLPSSVLVKTYLKLGRECSEGNTMRKVEIRGDIEKEIRRRGHNLHCLMSEVS